MKPLTLEEAKANIGKEVYLLPHTKPYGYTSYDGTHKSENLNYKNIIGKKIALVSLDDEFDVNVIPFDCEKVGSLEVIAMRHLSFVEPLKVGDTVKLDPSTKPYTWMSGEELNECYIKALEECSSHEVINFNDGNAVLKTKRLAYGVGVNPKHLKKVKAPEFEIGDFVTVNLSTRPYTFSGNNGETIALPNSFSDQIVYPITGTDPDGDVLLDDLYYIKPHHLIKIEEKTMTADQLIERNTVEDAKDIGVKSKLFSVLLDDTRFLWVNGQWVEGWVDDEFEPIPKYNAQLQENKREDHAYPKNPYTDSELELRADIAMKLLDENMYSSEMLNTVFNDINN